MVFNNSSAREISFLKAFALKSEGRAVLLVKQNLDTVLGLAEGDNVFTKGRVSLFAAPAFASLAVPGALKQ